MLLPRVTAEEFHALIAWTRDIFARAGITKAVLGLSGGADSALVAGILIAALGRENVFLYNLPIYSSGDSEADALRLAQEWLGMNVDVFNLERTLDALMSDSGIIDSPLFAELSQASQNNIHGNARARLRTTVLRMWAELHGALFINTCNWSETVVGYDTKGGGDADGDIQPIVQFVKDDIWSMLGMSEVWEAYGMTAAPRWIIEKIPTADIKPGQTDEGELGMPYGQLDMFARAFAAEGLAGVRRVDDPDGHLPRFVQLHKAALHKLTAPPAFERTGFKHDGSM